MPKFAFAYALAILFFGLLLGEVADLPNHTRMWRALQNFGHIPVYGLVALLCWRFLGFAQGGALGPRKHYLYAFLMSVLLGMVLEFRQLFSARDADFFDLLSDATGAFAALAWHALFNRGDYRPAWQFWIKAAAFMSMVAIMVASLPLASLALAYYQRAQRLPVLYDFSEASQQTFVTAQASRIRFTTSGLRVQFEAGAFPGVWLEEPYPDWRRYQALEIRLNSEASQPFKIVLRIHDVSHSQAYRDRYNGVFTVHPGANRWRIPLSVIADAPHKRRMDMQALAVIGLFTTDAEALEQAITLERLVLQ